MTCQFSTSWHFAFLHFQTPLPLFLLLFLIPVFVFVFVFSISSSFPLPFPLPARLFRLWLIQDSKLITSVSVLFCMIPQLLFCLTSPSLGPNFCAHQALLSATNSWTSFVFVFSSLLVSNCKSSPDDGIGHRFTHHPINIILRNVHLSRFSAFWTNTSSPKYILSMSVPLKPMTITV